MRRQYTAQQVTPPSVTPIIHCPLTNDSVDIINNITGPAYNVNFTGQYADFTTNQNWSQIAFPSQNSNQLFWGILNPIHDITVSFYVKVNDASNNPIFMFLPKNNQSYLTYLRSQNGYMYMKYGSGAELSTSFNTDWHHVVLTYSGAVMKLYIDKQIHLTCSTIYNSSVSNCNTVHLARITWGAPSTKLNGYMKDLKIFAQELTQDQINSL